jgi:hypothetical protein
MMEKERLDIFGSLAAGIAVTDMTYSHLALELFYLLFVEDFCHQTVSLDSMEYSIAVNSHDTATLLTSVLKGVQAIISQACSVLYTINSKHTTLMVQLVIPI